MLFRSDFTTTQEKDVTVFQVEKSTTANNFIKVGEVSAKNNNTDNSYTFTDTKPSNVNYYRVAAVSTNGTVQYSNIVRVDMNNNIEKVVRIYPNPVEGNVVNLQMNGVSEGKATMSIYNSIGKLVSTQNLTVSGTSTISVELVKSLPAGTYQLSITDAKGNVYNESLIKVK